MTPLAELRVLDLSRLLPGPFCTQLLADLGADVVKIEDPGGGDPARHMGDGVLFLQVNRNKRSLTLDLKTSAGRELFVKLAERADVVVDSFRPGVMERFGLGYPLLAGRNQRLIYATLSGYGQNGPYRDRAGHDLDYVALAGILGLNARAGEAPVPPAVPIADLSGGTLAAVAILAAVIARDRTGRGQQVDVSLFGAALSWLPTLLASYAGPGRGPRPGEPPLVGGLPQYDVYRTSDGRYVALGALEPKFLATFLRSAAREELTPLAAGDLSDRDRLRQELRAIVGARPLSYWARLSADVDACLAPVNTLDEALGDPQALSLGLVGHVDHPTLGRIPRVGLPIALSDSETPASVRREAPALGEHTAEVLAALGVDADQVGELRHQGVV